MALSARFGRLLGQTSLLLASTLQGCSEEELARTQIMVVVDSDLSVPDQLDNLTIDVSGPASRHASSTASLAAGELPLPRSLALVHESGALGPLVVEVRGQLAGQLLLSRRAELSFVPGRTLVLPMHLVRSCLSTQCGEGETCTEQGCSAVRVDAAELSEWGGEKPMLDHDLDAGTPGEDASASDAANEQDARVAEAGAEGGMCSPEPEQCNRRDDDCDGRIDDGFDLRSDENHCGSCNVRCDQRDTCCRGNCQRTCQ